MTNTRKYNRAKIMAHNEMRMQQLGHLLMEYRKFIAMSRDELSVESGISRSLIEKIENGQNVTLHTILRICDFFQTSPSEIFEEIE